LALIVLLLTASNRDFDFGPALLEVQPRGYQSAALSFERVLHFYDLRFVKK
jgi:hypothetical protein